MVGATTVSSWCVRVFNSTAYRYVAINDESTYLHVLYLAPATVIFGTVIYKPIIGLYLVSGNACMANFWPISSSGYVTGNNIQNCQKFRALTSVSVLGEYVKTVGRNGLWPGD